MTRQQWLIVICVSVLGCLAPAAYAEPYLAARTGSKCMACHSNPTGGGKRTVFGRNYGTMQLPADSDLGASQFGDAAVAGLLDFGADLRASASATAIPDQRDENEFATERGTIYLEYMLIDDRLSLYVDQQFAPGISNREARGIFWNASREYYIKFGRMFLPYGIRLEDDSAFVRAVPGINFNTPDDGVEFGVEKGPWSNQLALSNGAGGGRENNRGKRMSLRSEYVTPSWRVGGSLNANDGDDEPDRNMYNLFGLASWYGAEWLAEVDVVRDEGNGTADREQLIYLFEINKEVVEGHNVKYTYEFHDPDRDLDEDERVRNSLIWEYVPVRNFQTRVGLRVADGIPQNSQQNADLLFAQIHLWY